MSSRITWTCPGCGREIDDSDADMIADHVKACDRVDGAGRSQEGEHMTGSITITPAARGYLARAAAEARVAGVDASTQAALDDVTRLGITSHGNDMNLPYVVSDSKDVPIGGQDPILGAFATEDLAARFIETLPQYETGRYNLDGPADDWVGPPLRTYLDLSTSVITQREMSLIFDAPVRVIRHEYGAWVHVPPFEPDGEDPLSLDQSSDLDPEEEAELAHLEAEFERAGGRGVSLANRIDELRDRRELGEDWSEFRNLLMVLRTARAMGADWVNIDQDGIDVFPGLPTFVW